ARLYQAEMRRYSRFAEEEIRAMSKMYQDLVMAIIKQGQAEGAIGRQLNITLVKHMIIGTLDEVISTWLRSGREHDLVGLTDDLAALFLRGIGGIHPAKDANSGPRPK
ncbi:MAG: TetR/AcrR family transcriptional regulator C-terminal domain-containing protein, partial [Desulfobacterales bacterium]